MQGPTPFQSKNNIAVVFACDANFLPCCGVAISSLLKQANPSYYYDIFILHTPPLSGQTQAKFQQLAAEQKNVQLRFVDLSSWPSAWMQQMFLRENTSPSNYYRLMIAEIFTQYHKIIYLDCDILLLQDIAPLYNMPIPQDKVLAAVPDALAYHPDPAHRQFFAKHTQKLGLTTPFEYFNSGVLLWDLQAYRRQNLSEKLQYCKKKFSASAHMDQDILNAAFYGKTYLLPRRFNFFPQPLSLSSQAAAYVQEHTEAAKNPAIIHYAGIEKPWLYPTMPYAAQWWEQAEKTPFLHDIKLLQQNYEKKMRFYLNRRWLYWLLQWIYRLQNKLQKGKSSAAAAKAFALQERIQISAFWAAHCKK